jgi:hypothetical protein
MAPFEKGVLRYARHDYAPGTLNWGWLRALVLLPLRKGPWLAFSSKLGDASLSLLSSLLCYSKSARGLSPHKINQVVIASGLAAHLVGL